ncbi:MAG: hypothetical protein ACOCTG_00515, partial [Bacteroidota bacterium]
MLFRRAAGAFFALFLFASDGLLAQSFEPVGDPQTLDVATWNIEWFGYSDNGPNDIQRQFNNVRTIIEAADVDLFSVQEISNPQLFAALLDSLGEDYAGDLATYSQTQKIGFIYRTDAVAKRSVTHILEEFSSDFAGWPP